MFPCVRCSGLSDKIAAFVATITGSPPELVTATVVSSSGATASVKASFASTTTSAFIPEDAAKLLADLWADPSSSAYTGGNAQGFSMDSTSSPTVTVVSGVGSQLQGRKMWLPKRLLQKINPWK